MARIATLPLSAPRATDFVPRDSNDQGAARSTITDQVAVGAAALGISVPGAVVSFFDDLLDITTGSGWLQDLSAAHLSDAVIASSLTKEGFPSTGVLLLSSTAGGDYDYTSTFYRPGTGLVCDSVVPVVVEYRVLRPQTVSGDAFTPATLCTASWGLAGGPFTDDGPTDAAIFTINPDGTYGLTTVKAGSPTYDAGSGMPASQVIQARITVTPAATTVELSGDDGVTYTTCVTSSVAATQSTYVPVIFFKTTSAGGGGATPRLVATDWVRGTCKRSGDGAGAFAGDSALSFPAPVSVSSSEPAAVALSGSAGSSHDAARSDHVHAHGAQTDGGLHAAAVAAGASGFMTGAQATKLTGIESGAQAVTAAHVATALDTNTAFNIGDGSLGEPITIQGSVVSIIGDGSSSVEINALALTGTMDAGGQVIGNLAVPLVGADAATKDYVDTPRAPAAHESTHVTGGSDAIPVATTLVDGLEAAGDWDLLRERRRTMSAFYDFESLTGSNAFWTPSPLGTGATYALGTTEAGTCGVLKETCGTTTTGSTYFYGTPILAVGDGELRVCAHVRIPVLPDGTDTFAIFVGVSDTANAPSSNGYGFRVVYGTSTTKWICTSKASSVETSTTTTVAFSTSWTRLEIRVNAAGTSISFLIDGTVVATHTTNIPTSVLYPVFGLSKSAGTTSRDFYTDLYGFVKAFTTER